jgi:hypothetical protein
LDGPVRGTAAIREALSSISRHAPDRGKPTEQATDIAT